MSAGTKSITAIVPHIGSFEFHVHQGFDRYISDYLLQMNIWEPFATELFRRLCKPGDYVMDIGANIGWYTVLASRLAGVNGRVLAIEPELNNLRLLSKNVEVSAGDAPIEILNIALGASEGTSQLFLSATNMGDHHLFNDGEPRDSVAVKVRKLDDIFGDGSLKPTIVKSDSQGSEGRILQGASRLLAEGWRPVLILAFWPYGLSHSESDALDLLRKLDSFHYGIFEFSEEKPKLTSFTEGRLLSRFAKGITPDTQAYINLLCLPNRRDRFDLLVGLFA